MLSAGDDSDRIKGLDWRDDYCRNRLTPDELVCPIDSHQTEAEFTGTRTCPTLDIQT